MTRSPKPRKPTTEALLDDLEGWVRCQHRGPCYGGLHVLSNGDCAKNVYDRLLAELRAALKQTKERRRLIPKEDSRG